MFIIFYINKQIYSTPTSQKTINFEHFNEQLRIEISVVKGLCETFVILYICHDKKKLYFSLKVKT